MTLCNINQNTKKTESIINLKNAKQNISNLEVNSVSQKINNILMQYLSYKQLNELYELNSSLYSIFNNKNPNYNDFREAENLLFKTNAILMKSFEKLSLIESMRIDELMMEQFKSLDSKTKFNQIQ